MIDPKTASATWRAHGRNSEPAEDTLRRMSRAAAQEARGSSFGRKDKEALAELLASLADQVVAQRVGDREPTDLEVQISRAAQRGVSDAVVEALTTGYKNPLGELASAVVRSRSDKLQEIAERGLDAVIDSGDFAVAVEDAIRSKLARTLVGQLGGEIEKRINDLKSRPETRARLTLALDKMIQEFSSLWESQ